MSWRDSASDTSEILLRNGAKEGKYFVWVLGPGKQEQYVLWDHSETMTLMQVLAETGVGLEELTSIQADLQADQADPSLKLAPGGRATIFRRPFSPAEFEGIEIQDGSKIQLR
jgi:hypothetical protein